MVRGLSILLLILGGILVATVAAAFDIMENQAGGWFFGSTTLVVGFGAGWLARAPGFARVSAPSTEDVQQA